MNETATEENESSSIAPLIAGIAIGIAVPVIALRTAVEIKRRRSAKKAKANLLDNGIFPENPFTI